MKVRANSVPSSYISKEITIVLESEEEQKALEHLTRCDPCEDCACSGPICALAEKIGIMIYKAIRDANKVKKGKE